MAFKGEAAVAATSIRYDAIVKRPKTIPAGYMLDMWYAELDTYQRPLVRGRWIVIPGLLTNFRLQGSI